MSEKPTKTTVQHRDFLVALALSLEDVNKRIKHLALLEEGCHMHFLQARAAVRSQSTQRPRLGVTFHHVK